MSTAINKETLTELATLGQEGANAIVVLGKVRDITRWPAKDNRPANTALVIITGEGTSGKFRIEDGAAVPGKGHAGAFVVENCGEFPRGTMTGDIVEWA